MRSLIVSFLIFVLTLLAPATHSSAAAQATMPKVWSNTHFLQLLMDVEAALARSQSSLGIIPKEAAEEITRKAKVELLSQKELDEEQKRVGHPMVTLLNVWPRILEKNAGEFLHFGATSMDIFDTAYILQMRNAVDIIKSDLLAVEDLLLSLAEKHADTPMMGRTLGRHALPITFGLKISVWLAENRRHIDRLDDLKKRIQTGMVSGAVGSYAALGEKAFEVEKLTMKELGLAEPELADWKGARDRHAEYGFVLAGIAKTYGKIAQELFILQTDEYGEVSENNPSVGSSTMPHKQNPMRLTRVIAASRTVPAYAQMLADWMVSIHERDQISNAATLKDISLALDGMLSRMKSVFKDLEVFPEAMRRNMNRTNGLVMAEPLMFALGEKIGKHTAHEEVRLLAREAFARKLSLKDAVLARPELAKHFKPEELDALLDPTKYTGKSAEVTRLVVSQIKALRAKEGLTQK